MATHVFPWKYNIYLESNKYIDIFKSIHDLRKCNILTITLVGITFGGITFGEEHIMTCSGLET